MLEKSLEVLLVEDNDVDRMAFERFVEREALPYQYSAADSIERAHAILSSDQHFDIIVSNFALGDGTVLDIFSALRGIPLVVVTGMGDEERAVAAMKLGACDYLIKDPDGNYLKTLHATVQNAIAHRTAQEELARHRQHLESLVLERTKDLESEITERIHAENLLQESEKRYVTILDTVPDLVYEITLDGTVIYANRTASEVFGISRERIKTGSVSISDVLDADDLASATQSIAELGATKEPVHNTYTVRTADGDRFPIEADAVLMEHRGRAPTILGVARDLSERRQAAADRKKLEASLVKAQRMEALGTLAGGVAHDFNNILSAIMGFTELAQMSLPPDHEALANLVEVLKAGRRATDLTKQILTFSRQTEPERRPIQVGTIAREALKLLRASLPTTIEINKYIDTQLLVLGDPSQLHQVFMNLGTNAGHAMRKTGGVLEVRLEQVLLGPDFVSQHPGLSLGPHARLSFSDTGHGIAPDVVDRIFDPFFTTKERGEGTGLGLAVVHGIVKSYDGAIEIYSEEGVGTTIKLFLPVVFRDEAREPLDPKPAPSGTGQILLVDDEPSLVRLGRLMLESLGYEVTTCTNGAEALAVFHEQPDKFDLVVTDMTMPRMTGDQLSRELIEIRSNIPVILCTGFSPGISPEEATKIGIRSFIMKPFVRHELAAVIHRVLEED